MGTYTEWGKEGWRENYKYISQRLNGSVAEIRVKARVHYDNYTTQKKKRFQIYDHSLILSQARIQTLH